ncbi:YbbR-like domain-containing protein [Sulfobacillus sp. hq2]|uniref:CdaR family protein n=1 Tax=Sulfobacillus TaxID=28033 RepID=UPI000CD074B4|nr:CdaR family protein [Sulfobacillus sp. hq2]POB11949.1 hypothetical protein CO251_02275 [Sulfobacillus sp. hq2]
MMDRLLENNTILKILSVVVALFLWFQVTSTNSHVVGDRSIGPVPVEYNPPSKADLTVMSMNYKSVSVQVKGPIATVAKINPQSFSAFVDMKNITASGTYSLPVRVSVPAGTSFVNVVPNHVTVVIDQMGTRHMNVTLKAVGTPAPGYELTQLATNTQTAVVSGPMSDLDKIKELVADMPVGGRTSSFQEQVILMPLNSEDRLVSNVQVSPTMVTAQASIKKRPPEKTVGVVAKISGYPAHGYAVSTIAVHPASVVITGSKSALSQISVIYTVPISVSNDSASVSSAVPLAFPTGVSGVTTQDVNVHVTITRAG